MMLMMGIIKLTNERLSAYDEGLSWPELVSVTRMKISEFCFQSLKDGAVLNSVVGSKHSCNVGNTSDS